MIFRPATLEDADLLLTWRNDPETRANSYEDRNVTPAEHLAWLKAKLANPDCQLMIVTTNDTDTYGRKLEPEPLGVLRAEHGELSWTIAPEHRGKGYGRAMVRTWTYWKHAQQWTARIKPDNAASLAIAAYAGVEVMEHRQTAVEC